MKRAIVVSLVLVACNKGDATSSSASASASAPPPFTGALTGDRIMGSKDLVRPFDDWSKAQAKLEAQMGKATYVKDDKRFMWGVKQGDDCWYVEIEKQSDGTVGATQDPMKVSKGGALFNWDDCLIAAGARKETVDDPTAPGPPTDGKAIGVIDLRDGASKARTKWSNAKVTVRGFYMSTTTMVTNDGSTAHIAITAAKADLKNLISCVSSDVNVTQKMTQYTPITVTGTVDVQDMITGGGDRVVDVNLKDCNVTAQLLKAQ